MAQNQNYTHILTIVFDDSLLDNYKNEIITRIYNIINDKVIIKNTMNTNIPIRWIVSNESKMIYYTDVHGMLGDRAVYLHTEMLLNDIRSILNIDSFYFDITKPLMQQICML